RRAVENPARQNQARARGCSITAGKILEYREVCVRRVEREYISSPRTAAGLRGTVKHTARLLDTGAWAGSIAAVEMLQHGEACAIRINGKHSAIARATA